MTYSIGDLDGATVALERMAELAPDNADVWSNLGETRVLNRGGVISRAAIADFEAALALDPDEPRAIFYLAEAEYQAGRAGEAIARWSALADAAPADAPWLTAVGARLQRAALAAQVSLDGLGLSNETVAKIEAALSSGAPPPSAGPDAAAAAAIAALDPEAQAAQIAAMVERLEARLEAEPDNLDDWAMAARSYAALGRAADHVAALGEVARLSPSDAEAQRAYAYGRLNLNAESGAELEPATVAALSALLDLDADDPLALLTLGVVAHSNGDDDRSRALLERLAQSEAAPTQLRDQAREQMRSYGFTSPE